MGVPNKSSPVAHGQSSPHTRSQCCLTGRGIVIRWSCCELRVFEVLDCVSFFSFLWVYRWWMIYLYRDLGIHVFNASPAKVLVVVTDFSAKLIHTLYQLAVNSDNNWSTILHITWLVQLAPGHWVGVSGSETRSRCAWLNLLLLECSICARLSWRELP